MTAPSDTPQCDEVDAGIDSNDYRAWRTHARTLERQLSEARQKAIKECVTVLERREAEHLKNYRGGSDFAADYLHEIEQCTEALRALLKEKP